MKTYKPIEFRQLCMVAKSVIQQAPAIDDAEWKAQIRDRLQVLGFDEPDPESVSRAMTQVEQALRRTVGPRLSRAIPEPTRMPAPTPEPPKESRTNAPMGWEIVVGLMRRLRKVSPVLESTSRPQSPRRELVGITEVDALNEFWRQTHAGTDKLQLLRSFAEVAIVRPDGWNYAEIRADFERMAFSRDACFVCNFEHTHRHHVIQIQHGGSNYVRNLLPLCESCHHAVHPWLEDGGRWPNVGAWSSVGDMAKAMTPAVTKKRA